MDRDYLQINKDNLEAILKKIEEETQQKIKDILDEAEMSSKKILEEVAKEIEEKKEYMVKEAKKEIEKKREVFFSTLNLDKRRIILEEKNRFVENVLAEVVKRAERFRKEAGYVDFLKKAILEGIEGVGYFKMIDILYSFLDESIFNEDFISKIKYLCKQNYEEEISLSFIKSDFTDIGVIVRWDNGRVIYDNRFLTYLSRRKEDIYNRLMRMY
ncbi:MAG: V-type ATP synthase subunit E family protein [Candidatus Omnitrophica bacterium]|nr:V-type ATP synthase subunit E family protein [Candidatus Omnitrophota bacterium]